MNWLIRKKPSVQDLLKEISIGTLDLAKGVTALRVKEAVSSEYFSQLAKDYVPEVAKALTGTAGKILLALVFKQFDQTSKSIALLEERWKDFEYRTWEAARSKFLEAVEYPERSVEEMEFRRQLFNEARVALVHVVDTCPMAPQRVMQCLHSAFLCACEVPGGNVHASQLFSRVKDAAMERIRILKNVTRECERAEASARFYTVQVSTGQTKWHPQRGYQMLGGGGGEVDVTREERREHSSGPFYEVAEQWKLCKEESEKQVQFIENMLSESEQRLQPK